MRRSWFAIAVAAAVLLPVSREERQAYAQIARNAMAPGEKKGEPRFAPFDSMACPESRELTGSGWRGFLSAASSAKVQSLCGRRGRWTFFRAHPFAGGLEILWESDKPVAVAIGWGACDSKPRFCAEGGAALIPNWPKDASLWIAVLDPAAPTQVEEPDQGDATGGDSSDSGASTGTSSETGPDPGVAMSLRWRAR